MDTSHPTVQKYIKVGIKEAVNLQISIVGNTSLTNEYGWFKDQQMQEALVIAHGMLQSFLSRSEKETFSFKRSGNVRVLGHIKQSLFRHHILVPNSSHPPVSDDNLPVYGLVNVYGKKVSPFLKEYPSHSDYTPYKVLPHSLFLYFDSFELPSQEGVISIRKTLDRSWSISSCDIVSVFQLSDDDGCVNECGYPLSDLNKNKSSKRQKKSASLSLRPKKSKAINSLPGQTTITRTFSKLQGGGHDHKINTLTGIDKSTNLPSSISNLIFSDKEKDIERSPWSSTAPSVPVCHLTFQSPTATPTSYHDNSDSQDLFEVEPMSPINSLVIDTITTSPVKYDDVKVVTNSSDEDCRICDGEVEDNNNSGFNLIVSDSLMIRSAEKVKESCKTAKVKDCSYGANKTKGSHIGSEKIKNTTLKNARKNNNSSKANPKTHTTKNSTTGKVNMSHASEKVSSSKVKQSEFKWISRDTKPTKESLATSSSSNSSNLFNKYFDKKDTERSNDSNCVFNKKEKEEEEEEEAISVKPKFDLRKMLKATSERLQELEANKKTFATKIEFSEETERVRAKIRGDKEILVLSSGEEEEEEEREMETNVTPDIEAWRLQRRTGPNRRQANEDLFAGYKNINEITALDLTKWLKLRKATLVKIFKGEIKSDRHDKYITSKKEKATLQYQISTVMFTSEQIEIITDGLHQIFCHRSEQIFDYMWLVLFPEAVIHLIMDYHQLNYDEAEKKMYNYYPVKTESV